jgi:hypothetical protein
MPFEKTGPCPFTGEHWPSQWGEEKITAKKFSSLPTDQKKDLIDFFYEHEIAKTSARSKPAYRFPLWKLREYFGAKEQNIRVCVQQSQEYKDYVAERQRSQAPPPPPEMSLLTSVRIVACLRAEPPEIDKVRRMAGDHFRDREERKSASAAQVVRQADREAAGITFLKDLPTKDGMFVPGASASRKHAELNFEKDPHRAIVCNMQKAIEAAVDDKIGDAGDLSTERKLIFARQVEEERRKDLVKTRNVRKDAGAPYTARAALGLILLLSSILW